MKKRRQITLILTDFTERIGGNFIHLPSEQTILSNLLKISSISEISGSNLPFQGKGPPCGLKDKKRALELPPDFTAHAFFSASRLRPESPDFPPEIR
jgi:hypothetical protein